jgi:hypothetical protein
VVASMLLMMAFATMVSMAGCGKGLTQTPIGTANIMVSATVTAGSGQTVAPNQQMQIAVTVTP